MTHINNLTKNTVIKKIICANKNRKSMFSIFLVEIPPSEHSLRYKLMV